MKTATVETPAVFTITIPRFQLGRGGNDREHWTAEARRKKQERGRVIWAWLTAKGVPPPAPWAVRLVRCSPADGLDYDNLVACFKHVRDQVAAQLHLPNDRDARGNELDRVAWTYAEDTRTAWAVRIEISTRQART